MRSLKTCNWETVQRSPGEDGTIAELAMLTTRVQLVKLDEVVENHYIHLQYFQYHVQFWPPHDSTCQSFHSGNSQMSFMQLSRQSCPSNIWDHYMMAWEPHKTQPSNNASSFLLDQKSFNSSTGHCNVQPSCVYLNTVDNNGSCLVQVQICEQVTRPSDIISNRTINSGGSGVSCVWQVCSMLFIHMYIVV